MIWRYLMKGFFLTFIRVSLIISLVIVIIDFFEVFRGYADDHISFMQIVYLLGLRLPNVYIEVLPIIIVISSLAFFLGLARHSELVVIRASGVSAARIASIVAFCCLGIGIFTVAVGNPIRSYCAKAQFQFENQIKGRDVSAVSLSKDGLWFRQSGEAGPVIIHSKSAYQGGTKFEDITFFFYNQKNKITERIFARTANLKPNIWELDRALIWRITDKGTISWARPRYQFEARIKPNEILQSIEKPEDISIWDLPEFIEHLDQSGFTTQQYSVYLYSQLALPILLISMALIGGAFAMRPMRFGNTGILAFFAILSGFIVFVVNSLSLTLAESNVLPQVAAVLTPPIASIMIFTAIILHLEDG